MKLSGAMGDLVLLDILFITGNCFLRWLKVPGVRRSVTLPPQGHIQLQLQNQVLQLLLCIVVSLATVKAFNLNYLHYLLRKMSTSPYVLCR